MMPDGLLLGTGRDNFHPLRRSRILQRMLLAAAAIELRKQQFAPPAADPNPPFHITHRSCGRSLRVAKVKDAIVRHLCHLCIAVSSGDKGDGYALSG
jgi:hypothetical protein